MKQVNNINHVLCTELDCIKEWNIKTCLSERGIILDIKYLLSEFYVATFCDKNNSLNLSFDNGQSFRITVQKED